MARHELAIIGAGPSGASAAISAASRGVDTVLFDDAPRHPEPGETVPAGAEVLFGMLGVESVVNDAVAIRHRGHWSDWSGVPRLQAFGADSSGQWRGYQIARGTLRRILLERARQAGVQIIGERCIGVLRRGAAVGGVETATGKTHARLVIDATGGSHWLARVLGKDVRAASRPMIAWYGWASSARAGEFAEPRLTLHDDGWTWIAQ